MADNGNVIVEVRGAVNRSVRRFFPERNHPLAIGDGATSPRLSYSGNDSPRH